MSNLNPDQFFHGTRAAVKGDMIRPANDVDREPSEASMGDPGDMSEGDHAFAIRNDERYAWHAALQLSNGGGRAKVYDVAPAPDMKPGPWNKDHPDFLKHHELDIPEGVEHDREYQARVVSKARADHQDEWASQTGFKIKNRIDIMPGRQGTFPQANWNRLSRWHGDANHPNDEQVKFGMAGLQKATDPKKYAPVDGDPRSNRFAPRRRKGAALRAFMEGKPETEVDPHEGQGRLF